MALFFRFKGLIVFYFVVSHKTKVVRFSDKKLFVLPNEGRREDLGRICIEQNNEEQWQTENRLPAPCILYEILQRLAVYCG